MMSISMVLAPSIVVLTRMSPRTLSRSDFTTAGTFALTASKNWVRSASGHCWGSGIDARHLHAERLHELLRRVPEVCVERVVVPVVVQRPEGHDGRLLQRRDLAHRRSLRVDVRLRACR